MLKKIIQLFIGAFFIMMSSCVTQKKCNTKFPAEKETVIEHHFKETFRDSMLPGSTVRDTITINNNYPVEINRWHYTKDTSGLASLRWKIDEQGKFIAECRAEKRNVKLKETETSESYKRNEKVIQVEKETPWYVKALLFILIGAVIYLGVFKK